MRGSGFNSLTDLSYAHFDVYELFLLGRKRLKKSHHILRIWRRLFQKLSISK